jgi:hypothetical protein
MRGQSADRQDARTYHPDHVARPCRRSDRVIPPALLQCMGLLLALGVFRCGAQNCDAIGGTADIDWPPAPIASEAYDP